MKAFGELAAMKGGLEGAKAIVTRALTHEFTTRIAPWELVVDAVKHQGTRPTNHRNGATPQQATRADAEEVINRYQENRA